MPDGTGAAIRPSCTHHGVLALLDEAGLLSQQAAGLRLRIDRQTMVALVDDLERSGFVERRRDHTDRRSFALELTDPGLQMLAGAAAIAAGSDEKVLGDLAASERSGS